jgi:hypothetical protein
MLVDADDSNGVPPTWRQDRKESSKKGVLLSQVQLEIVWRDLRSLSCLSSFCGVLKPCAVSTS